MPSELLFSEVVPSQDETFPNHRDKKFRGSKPENHKPSKAHWAMSYVLNKGVSQEQEINVYELGKKNTLLAATANVLMENEKRSTGKIIKINNII